MFGFTPIKIFWDNQNFIKEKFIGVELSSEDRSDVIRHALHTYEVQCIQKTEDITSGLALYQPSVIIDGRL